MTVDDISQVAEIERQIFSIPWSEKAFRNSMESDNTIYIVAKENNNVAGYAGMYLSFEEGNITNVAVNPLSRRKGIGEKIVRDILNRAYEKGVRDVFLEVRETNSVAIALYEKIGFKEEGIRKNFYDKPRENALIMWKHNL
ncbi:ribosomal-protein-alanine N-acetyltransferase [Eubacterium sp. AF15-50]|nr:ribosomal-protein-alanine N-acetyltransferase [Eubacterium sp. AF16-48]RHR78881.1 ribosomal-protein-alanine N-acetyltransferase [Eubacterium sp. AF15-50]